MTSKKKLKQKIATLKAENEKLRSRVHDVSVYTHTDFMETDNVTGHWVTTPKPGYQGVISPGSDWVVTQKKWKDDEGNVLKYPVTSKVTLKSRKVSG